MVTKEDLTVGGGHNAIHRSCVTEMDTRNLCDLINQCHPNTFNTRKRNNSYFRASRVLLIENVLSADWCGSVG